MTPVGTTRTLKLIPVFMKSTPPPLAMLQEQSSPYKSMAGQSALLDTGTEWSCMNLDTYEKLKINCLNTSFMPTLKGATGHDMLAKGITTFDFTINIHTFTVCTKMSRPIILGRDFTIPNAISVGWTGHGTKKLCTDDKLVLETEENFEGKTGTIQVHLHPT